MSYWENRSVQQIYEAMKDAESIADQMSRTYMKASVWLNEQGRDIFERFRKKWDLSEEEARKLIEAAGNGATAQQLVQTYMASGGKDKTLIREMESYAFRARLERLADISLQLDRIMQNVYQQEVKKTTAFYKNLADDQYYKTIFNLQQRAGYGFSFSHVSEKQIDRMLQMKWYGQNYSQRIWKNTRELTEDLKTEMLVSLITGRTDRETAEIFNRKYGAGAIKSRRLIRTEAAWVSSQMVLAGYKDAKIKEYMYLATLDLRTSQMCRDMDGKIFPVEEYTIGKTAPPLHPWCRSTTIAIIHREWLADMKRTAKDANGKLIRIPANMTYQEWYDTYIKDNPAGQAEEKKIKNRSADRQQHEKYRKILGNKVPESFVRFQDMKYNDPEKWEKLKADKQNKLNAMEFSEMGNLKGTLGNGEVRAWYKAHDERIPELLDSSAPLEQQARQACEMRNTNRTAARELMKDQKLRKQLDKTDPNKGFEQLLQDKMQRKGLTKDEAVEDVLRTATKTRKTVNKMFGLE